LAAWAVVSLLAVAAHYFALFLVLAQAAALLWRLRRGAVLAVAGLGAGLLALAPLILYQRENGGAEWIGLEALPPRVANTVTFLVAGPALPAPLPANGTILAPLLGLLAAAAIAVAVRFAPAAARDRTALLVAVGGAAIAVPVLAAIAGSDFVLDRNFIMAWLPLAAAVVVGLCVLPPRRLGDGVIAATAAISLAILVWVAADTSGQRDDWRGVAETIGPPRADRLITIAPGWEAVTLWVYRDRRLIATEGTPRVASVVAVHKNGYVPWGQPVARIDPGPPFRRRREVRVKGMTVVEYTAPRPVAVSARELKTPGINGVRAFSER
jgi:hypothetical protein